MRKALKRLGTVLLFAAVALCFLPYLVPPFLDRIYYRGPASGHYDGERFFNPGFRDETHGGPQRFVNRWLKGDRRAEWPEQVPVTPGYPPAASQEEPWVENCCQSKLVAPRRASDRSCRGKSMRRPR